MARERRERVHGPYQHGSKFRIYVDGADGSRVAQSFATKGEAERVAAETRGQIEGRTLSYAVEKHLAEMAERDLKACSIKRAEYHLDRFFRLGANGGRPVKWIARHAAELYAEARKEAAVDTHRNALAAARHFAKWCVEQGWIPANPFARVKGVGRRKRGKPQLRVDEATKLVDTCLSEWSPESAGVLCAFLLGMRATEVATRQVRDLDDGGRLLWIPDSKTPAGRRTLEVPFVLRPLLLELAGDRAPEAGLLGEGLTRYWTHYHARRLCRVAGVPPIPPHGLRGTHTTMADEAGITGHAIAAAVGHASPVITRQAYIDAGRSRDARTRRVEKRLGSGKFSADSPNHDPET